MAVTLRRATYADVPAVLALWSRAAENDARPPDRADLVGALLDRDPGALVVAVHADPGTDEVVGTIVAGWDGWRAHLYRLAVDPRHRGHGVGRRLLVAAEERLVALGATRLDAMVLDDNALGAALWRSAGYQRQDRWGRWVKPVVDPPAR